MDNETGWSAFELRNYNSTIGRWLSPDPYAQHWSPYLAMSNNPVSFIDPDGGNDTETGEPLMPDGWTIDHLWLLAADIDYSSASHMLGSFLQAGSLTEDILVYEIYAVFGQVGSTKDMANDLFKGYLIEFYTSQGGAGEWFMTDLNHNGQYEIIDENDENRRRIFISEKIEQFDSFQEWKDAKDAREFAIYKALNDFVLGGLSWAADEIPVAGSIKPVVESITGEEVGDFHLINAVPGGKTTMKVLGAGAILYKIAKKQRKRIRL